MLAIALVALAKLIHSLSSSDSDSEELDLSSSDSDSEELDLLSSSDSEDNIGMRCRYIYMSM